MSRSADLAIPCAQLGTCTPLPFGSRLCPESFYRSPLGLCFCLFTHRLRRMQGAPSGFALNRDKWRRYTAQIILTVNGALQHMSPEVSRVWTKAERNSRSHGRLPFWRQWSALTILCMNIYRASGRREFKHRAAVQAAGSGIQACLAVKGGLCAAAHTALGTAPLHAVQGLRLYHVLKLHACPCLAGRLTG